jgi:hypothetical protein
VQGASIRRDLKQVRDNGNSLLQLLASIKYAEMLKYQIKKFEKMNILYPLLGVKTDQHIGST